MKKFLLAVLVDNKPGVLTHVAGLISRRAFNIESISAGYTEEPDITRINIVVSVESENELAQVVSQLGKLIDVIKIVNLSLTDSIERELVLIKVKASKASRADIINVVNIFRANIVDVTPEDVVIELTGGDVTATSLLVLWLSALVSSVLDNIPFVATMIPLIQSMGQMGVANLDPIWWSLALGACLGGNGTLIGASANVVVASMAAQRGKQISFLGFMKIAFPVMVITVAISSVYVYIRYL